MADELTTYQKLARQFPTDAHKTLAARGGQTYVPWNLVAERLNEELTVTGWSFAVIREGFTEAECWVLGRLTATIDGETTYREQYGCADLKLGQSFNTDLLKKAGTDSLKKCAQVLGVALYLTDADDRAEVQAAMRNGNRTAPQKTAPVKSEARLKLEAAWNAGLVYARNLGLTPNDDGILDLDDAKLAEVLDGLRQQCKYVQAERKKKAAEQQPVEAV